MNITNDMSSTNPVRSTDAASPVASVRRLHRAVGAVRAYQPARAEISSVATLLSRAATELEASRTVRKDVVLAAKERVRNWQGLGEGQITAIAESLLADPS